MSNRRIAWLIALFLVLLGLALLVLTTIWPMPRAHGQERLSVEQLYIRTTQGDVFLVIASGQPSYTCVGCTVVAENTVLAPGYRATLNVRLTSPQWELSVTQGGQTVRVGSVYTQRLVIVRK